MRTVSQNRSQKATNNPECDGWARRLVRNFVVKRYVAAGLHWGEAASYYWCNGPCVGYATIVSRLEKWESRYARYRLVPVRRNTWIAAGGYGAAMVQELYIRNITQNGKQQ